MFTKTSNPSTKPGVTTNPKGNAANLHTPGNTHNTGVLKPAAGGSGC